MIAAESVAGHGAPTRAIWFVHGILGQGRNWRSLARTFVDAHPEFVAILPDLRCHGASTAPPPHTLAACARDLDGLAARFGPPDALVGHSFGGKVVLEWLSGRPPTGAPRAVILDSPPGPVDRGAASRSPLGTSDPIRVLALLRAIPTPAPDREALRRPLRAAGLPEALVAWLLSSTRPLAGDGGAAGWTWTWDLDGVEALLEDYFARDFRPFLRDTPHHVTLVRAGRSDRWLPADLAFPVGPHVRRELLPDAGHWVQVDDPAGTLAVVEAALDLPTAV